MPEPGGKCLADQLTLFKPGRADYPHPLLLAPPMFFTFRHLRPIPFPLMRNVDQLLAHLLQRMRSKSIFLKKGIHDWNNVSAKPWSGQIPVSLYVPAHLNQLLEDETHFTIHYRSGLKKWRINDRVNNIFWFTHTFSK